MFDMFQAMMNYEPELREILKVIIEQGDEESFHHLLDEVSFVLPMLLLLISRQINLKRHDARRDDLSTLKKLPSLFLPPNPHVKPLDPPLSSSSSKSDRGINHPTIAAMFCPRKHITRMLNELELDDITLSPEADDSDTDEDEDEESEDEDEEEEDSEDDDSGEESDNEERDPNAGDDKDKEKPKKIPKKYVPLLTSSSLLT
jgi:hypothetical protein